jgi:hypothetical protein
MAGQGQGLRLGTTAAARGHHGSRPGGSRRAHPRGICPGSGVKEALLAGDTQVYFTTPHFDGYAAILVRLDRISVPELQELLVEAWLSRAPKRLAKQYLAGLSLPP